MANDPKNTEKTKGTKGRKKEFGEWDSNGVRTRTVKTYVRLDLSNKDSRKDNPSNFEEITYTERNFRNVDAAQKTIGKNLLAVLNAGVAAQDKKNATSIVSAARKMAEMTGGTIQEEMEAIRTRLASKRSAK